MHRFRRTDRQLRPGGLFLMATAGEQGVIDDVMMKTITRWRLAAEGAFLNLSLLLKLELAGPWTHLLFRRRSTLRTVQPPILTLARRGFLIRAEAKKSSCPVRVGSASEPSEPSGSGV